MSGQSEGLTYSVDIVLCFDATGSMSPLIDMVKSHAVQFYSDVSKALALKQKKINDLRARVVVYRDLLHDGPHAMLSSPFFDLPAQQEQLAAFVHPVKAMGGEDEPESGLEALAVAMRSDWVRSGDRRRHVIVLWTDASAHQLEKASTSGVPGYPTDLPKSFGELTELWEGQGMDRSAKRLLLYAPDAYPWNDIQNTWERTVHIVSKAGSGLNEIDYSGVLEVIANSV